LRCGTEVGVPYIEVVDTGVGIPALERERVLERFFRASNARGSGSGLGLAIVKEVTELHGGTLTIGAGPAAAGTRVRLALPTGGAVDAITSAGVLAPVARRAAG
jgi:two-component system sensor histidine kinase TctE